MTIRAACAAWCWLGAATAHAAPLRDFHLDDPVAHAKMRERYGTRVPPDEP